MYCMPLKFLIAEIEFIRKNFNALGYNLAIRMLICSVASRFGKGTFSLKNRIKNRLECCIGYNDSYKSNESSILSRMTPHRLDSIRFFSLGESKNRAK